MTPRKRQAGLLATMAALLLLAAAWSYGRYAAARTAAAEGRRGLIRCRGLVRRIDDLRRRPDLAGVRAMQMSELAGKVERAAAAARLPPDAVTRIWPDQPRRGGQSVYKERPTQIALKNVALQQLVVFLHTLTAETPGLWVKDLRMTAPRGQESGETWDVQAVVSYLVYDPPKGLR